MIPEASRSAGRQAMSLLLVAALLLFQLLARADLALAGAQGFGPTHLCSGSPADSDRDGTDAHRACALACAIVCHAQILPPVAAFALLRTSEALVQRVNQGQAGLAGHSIALLHIRGPPGPVAV